MRLCPSVDSSASPLITHRIGIDDFETGFAALIAGEAGKVVMDWG